MGGGGLLLMAVWEEERRLEEGKNKHTQDDEQKADLTLNHVAASQYWAECRSIWVLILKEKWISCSAAERYSANTEHTLEPIYKQPARGLRGLCRVPAWASEQQEGGRSWPFRTLPSGLRSTVQKILNISSLSNVDGTFHKKQWQIFHF